MNLMQRNGLVAVAADRSTAVATAIDPEAIDRLIAVAVAVASDPSIAVAAATIAQRNFGKSGRLVASLLIYVGAT